MKSGRDSGSRFAGMVMVGLVLAAALTLGVVLAPAVAYHEGTFPPAGDTDDQGVPDSASGTPAPDADETPTIN